MTHIFKPMLSATVNLEGLAQLKYPLLCTPKIDGIRVLINSEGIAVSRTLKPIRNKAVQKYLSQYALPGMDGEIIVGSLEDPLLFRKTTSGVMSTEGSPDFTYWVFDYIPGVCNYLKEDAIYYTRAAKLVSDVTAVGRPRIKYLPFREIDDADELEAYEAVCIKQGFEGVMLRDPKGRYKMGRSTANEGILMKLKRFEHSEAVIVDFVERKHNANEAYIDNLGFLKRSAHQENKVGRGDLGVLVCKDLKTDRTAEVGTGFDDQLRKEIWNNKDSYVGKIVRYKYLPYGSYDNYRHATFEGFRDQEDLS